MSRKNRSRDELVAIVAKLLDADNLTDEEYGRLVDEFEAGTIHPAGSTLIFFPDSHFGEGSSPSAEEIVDKALAYRPIMLGPSKET